MTVRRTAGSAARHLGPSAESPSRRAPRPPAAISPEPGERLPRVTSRVLPGRGWPLAAAVTGVTHAGVVASDGAWPTIGLAAAAVLATAAGVAALVAACSIR